MDKFCNIKCMHLNRASQRCTKFKQPLPSNVELKIFRCKECLEEEKYNEGKNKIRHNN